MVDLDGGEFLMGTDDADGFPGDGEGPVREVQLSGFLVDRWAVSNRRFAEFVDASGYVTDAERYGWSFVFGGLLPDEFPNTRGVVDAPWWRQVEGADWSHPEGPQSEISDRLNHPVVHVSWNDAEAFCGWAGLRLLTEAEWEYAARGGLVQKRFPWGDEREPDGEHRMNIWQGTFPSENTMDDGYLGTCPIDQYPANDFGLHNTSGNVWEWCSDWFVPRHQQGDVGVDPAGPPQGEAKVTRGGSYLCHESYCNRYRVAARLSNSPDTSTGNTGFRCAASAEPAHS
jgi:formylglycine-generating enzyme required for sulfatase activity